MRHHTPARTNTFPLALSLCAALAACASTSKPAATDAPEMASDSNEKEGDADDPAERERKVAVQRRKIELAQLELEAAAAKHESAMLAARAELQMAESELETFRAYEVGTRVDSAQLDLRGTKDRAQEAAEELAQIELMYEDQDLDDRTAEFVVQRGRRNAERAAQRIAIEERGLERLTQRTLPAEEAKLALGVERARAGLRDTEAGARIELEQKRMELDDLRHELTKLLDDSAGAKP